MSAIPSIRQRLSRTLLGVSVAWGVAVSGALWLAIQHEVDELMDNTLRESAEILFGLLSYDASRLPHEGGAMPAPPHEEKTVWQIVDGRQTVLLRSHQAPDQALLPKARRGFSAIGDSWRVYGMPLQQAGSMLYVAQRGSLRREARLNALAVLAGGALGVGLLCALWLRVRVRRELEPVYEMSEAVQRFDPLHPGTTLAHPARQELVPVHEAIRDLGERLSERLASERAFSAHAAHALRTPLAGMVAQLAVAQRKSPPEAQAALARSRQAADRLQRVVSALLALFRTGTDVKWQPVRLADLATYLPLGACSLETEGSESLEADPDLLAAALMNLVDNAVRHGATRVVVSVRQDGECTLVRVRDNGSGIPEPQRTALQTALTARAYEGQMGLGLMLADLVARTHGGRLTLMPCDDGGLVELRLGRPPPRSPESSP